MIVDLSKRWMERGTMACRGRDPELFFTDHSVNALTNPTKKLQRHWDRAKRICHTCPVMRECARDNLGEIDGVWGGLDPAQRQVLRSVHSEHVHNLDGPRKEEYAKLAQRMRERQVPSYEIARVMGISIPTVAYLADWWNDRLERRKRDGVTDLELPEPEDETNDQPSTDRRRSVAAG